jgi:hypothetical protein
MKSLFEALKTYGYNPWITGSGSGCFMLHRDKNFLEAAKPIIAKFLHKTSLLAIVNLARREAPGR